MTPGFLLDADTVSFALRGQGRVASTLLEHRPSELGLSSITFAELRFGAEVKASRKLRVALQGLVTEIPVLPFDQAAAERFAVIAARLAAGGQPIGSFDTLLAAHALSLGATVVTHNTRHFKRVPGLRIEDWY